MLQSIRDGSQGIVAKVIIGVIVLVFALWGAESIIGGFVDTPPVAEINGEPIDELRLQNSVGQVLASIGPEASNLDPGLIEDIALGQLIDEVLLRQVAERSGLAVSSAQIDQFILNSPQFQINGVFDSELAVRTMAGQGLSVADFRADLSRRMAVSQLANAFIGTNFLTPTELRQLIELRAQTRDMRYIAIPMGARTLATPINDARIREYYDANEEAFREPDNVVARYVVLDKAVIADEIELAPGEAQARYEEERADYQGAAEKRASHILFDTFEFTEDEAMERAQAARLRLDAGEDFASLALELSSDTISAEVGGDIGYTDGTAFPPEVEQALAELEVGGTSQPVSSEFGVHLLLLTEDSQNEYPPFAEVSARIENELKSAEVELIYSARLNDLSNLAFESGDLLGISEQLGLPVLTSAAFTRSGGTDIFADPAVVAAVFSDEVLLDGNNSDVIEIDDARAAVVRVAEFNESFIRPLEDARAEISVLLRSEMEREAVAAIGAELLGALENGGDVDGLLAENDLAWIEQEAVGRDDNRINFEIVLHLFAMSQPETTPLRDGVTLGNGTFVVIELSAVHAGSLDDLPLEQRQELARSLAQDLGNNDFESYLRTLREEADINRPQSVGFGAP